MVELFVDLSVCILYVDMDVFYVLVELFEYLEFVGKFVIVGY